MKNRDIQILTRLIDELINKYKGQDDLKSTKHKNLPKRKGSLKVATIRFSEKFSFLKKLAAGSSIFSSDKFLDYLINKK